VSLSPLSRLAGPFALIAGALMLVSQLVWLPFDTDDHQATSQNVVFQAGGVAYLIGFCMLMLALVAAYGWQAEKAGTFGLVAFLTAIVGTMLLAGDLWFETYAVPWIADSQAPQILDEDPSALIAAGAVSSYVLFAVGWALFAIASLRARIFPRAICLAIAIGGVIGFSALLSPFGIPLALAIGWLGVWMIKTTRRADRLDLHDAELDSSLAAAGETSEPMPV